MALMTEERRKEMEEEMSRFELEIAAPGGLKTSSSSNDLLIGSKPLSPPPPPPAVAVLIPPDVLGKAPPPPPPSTSSPPIHAVLRAPPPPPPPPGPVQARMQAGPMRFIPHQLNRQPPRPPMRPNFGPMRAVPLGGPPGFPAPGSMGPFVQPMGQVPSGPHMSHMGPGPMGMGPGPMPMPPQMGNMNVSLPMPPGFCPPTGPAPNMAPGGALPCDSQPFMASDGRQSFEPTVSESASSGDSATVVAAAPAIYAAPFVKSHAESASEAPVSSNGQENTTTAASTATTPKFEKLSSSKTEDHVVGPTTVSSMHTNEEPVVSKKKEKKKKIVRMAGGQAWEDNSLMEWDPDDFRIFCGDLGNDVTDEVLIRAFSKYASFVKAKVIRDKRTNKTKGYGFVSFKDPQDFIKAMREMNGKYVGSRPIKLRKSTWKDRNIELVKKKQREKEKLGLL